MDCAYFPIRNITTYTTNWTLLARIIDKSQLRSNKNDNSFLYIDIIDKYGDTIRGKFWGIAAVKWNELLEKGCVYKFSKASVNLANKKYNSTPHNYELIFNADSLIEPADEICHIEMEKSYQFVTLRDIKSTSREMPFLVDLLVFAKQISPISIVTTKMGKDMKRRALHVVDDTGYELEITIWGDNCDLPILEDVVDKALILSRILIKEWNGSKQGQTSTNTEIKLADHQSVKEKDRLLNLVSWYQQATLQNENFKSMRSQSIGNNAIKDLFEFCTISKVISKSKGNFSFNCKLRRIYWKGKEGVQRLWYQSCPMCFKKVIMDEDTNIFRCISCDDAIVVPILRYFFSCVFIDYSGQIFCNVYGDHGTKLIGMSEEELNDMDKEQIKNMLEFAVIHKDFKVTGFYKSKTYNGETKNVFNVTNIEPVDYSSESQILMNQMQIEFDVILKCFNIMLQGLETDYGDQKKKKGNNTH